MGLFSRIFRWGQSEAHSTLDKLEDPVKMTEQGLRELRRNLEDSLKGLAEVKALAIRSKREVHEKKQLASDYEKKAMLLVSKAQKGDLPQNEADRLAMEALSKKEGLMKQVLTHTQSQKQHEQTVSKMEENVRSLKSQISTWENELQTLKARSKVAQATLRLNKQLSQIDSGGTISMLEKMRERVDEQETLSQSYGEIASSNNSIDNEIDKALSSGESPVSSNLAELKSKMGVK